VRLAREPSRARRLAIGDMFVQGQELAHLSDPTRFEFLMKDSSRYDDVLSTWTCPLLVVSITRHRKQLFLGAPWPADVPVSEVANSIELGPKGKLWMNLVFVDSVTSSFILRLKIMWNNITRQTQLCTCDQACHSAVTTAYRIRGVVVFP
jgi:hypothetical protein